MSILVVSALGLGLASIAGSAAGLLIRKVSHRWNDIFLGFCAGMMLAASLVCLLLPAIRETDITGLWQVASGTAAGVMLVGVLDKFTPHLHRLAGKDMESHHNSRSLNRILLFVMAIALHKFPEGLATGIAIDGTDACNSMTITLAIGLQNIPEGMVVVTPLLLAGVNFARVLAIALGIAALEVAGVFAGYGLGSISAAMLPALLGMAGGAMLYVISDEMIPETHSHGYQKPATYALVAGVFVTLLLEKFA